MGKGGGRGGDAKTAVRRRSLSKAGAGAGPAEGPVGGAPPVAKDFPDDERDRPERFTGPEPVLPTKWWHAAHHALALAACVVLHFATSPGANLNLGGRAGGGFFYSLPLTLWMLWYGDAYTAVLHCALDRPECLNVSILNGAARGFQAHHEFPYASTRGRGLYRMICDTHRIQVITIVSALVFGRWNAMTARVCLMKLAVSAYGGAAGHFYAHGGGSARPAWVKAAQRARLLLHPKHHVGGHHVAPHGKNFGIVNGWSNRALNCFLRHDAPSVDAMLWLWGFLSLFDVALIERCVAPSEALLSRAWEAGMDTARAFVVRSL
jgi:hypothetical protein